MKDIICSHCGKTMPGSYTRCPGCGAVIENQQQLGLNSVQKRFVTGFLLLILFCFVLALWLPR